MEIHTKNHNTKVSQLHKLVNDILHKNKTVKILRLAIYAIAEASMMDPVEYLKGEGYDEETANLILTDDCNAEYVENLLSAELTETLRDVLNKMSMSSFVNTEEYLKGEGYSKQEIGFILGT